MDVWFTRIRYALIVLNILYFGMGVGVLGFGLFLLTDKTVQEYAFTDDMKESLVSVGTGIVANGVYIILTGMFGFLAILCNNRCLLTFVFLMLGPISVGFNIAGIYLLNEYSKLEKDLVDVVVTGAFEFGVEYYFEEGYELFREGMDMLQRDLKCCGATHGIYDYPPSKHSEVACSHYDTPCVDKLQDFLYTSIETTIACFLVIANTAVIKQVLSVAYCCVFKNQRRRVSFKE